MVFLNGLSFFFKLLAFVPQRIPGRRKNQPWFPEVDSRSQKSQAKDWFNTFVKAHMILSNPFLPWSIEGRRKLSSITVIAISCLLKEIDSIGLGIQNLSFACFLPPLRIGFPVSPVRSNVSFPSSILRIPDRPWQISFDAQNIFLVLKTLREANLLVRWTHCQTLLGLRISWEYCLEVWLEADATNFPVKKRYRSWCMCWKIHAPVDQMVTWILARTEAYSACLMTFECLCKHLLEEWPRPDDLISFCWFHNLLAETKGLTVCTKGWFTIAENGDFLLGTCFGSIKLGNWETVV